MESDMVLDQKLLQKSTKAGKRESRALLKSKLNREIEEEKYKIAKGIVDDYLDAAIKHKVINYIIKFMLYRYQKYGFMLLFTSDTHEKLGDLMRRQQEIRINLPKNRKLIEELAE